MEETYKSELTKLTESIQAELELIGCKSISILTVPIKNTGSTDPIEKTSSAENVKALHLEFIKNSEFYDVLVTKCIDQNWNDRLCVKVQTPRIFRDNEMIPLSSLNIHDTLTVIKDWGDSTAVRLVHNVSGSITCKTPCDINTTAAELVTHIFEISKL
jgi:hypothetical protein